VRIVLIGAAAAVLLVATPIGAGAKSQPPLTGWLAFGNGPARTGATAATVDPKTLRPAFFRTTTGMDTVQPLVVSNVPSAGTSTTYVATSAGRVVASAPNGYVRWQRTLGAAPNSCPQLDEYGIEGTPVVDAATRSLYVADAFGLLHSLDLVTGKDRPGWPVRIYDDPSSELVWGALLDVRGSIYVGTGSYCDRAMEGKLIRVEISSRHVSSWTAVPKSLGGGGSIWGWGGASYSAARDSLFVVTGNAFEGGSNTGSAFDEAAGYGEQLVELTRDLHVRAANHPASITGTGDFDFAGSPVIFTPPGCGELVAAANKNGHVFVWSSSAISAGPVADLAVQTESQAEPLLTQPAYDPATRSLYVVTFTSLIRIALDGCNGAHVAWKQAFPNVTLQGSPTIAGRTVWVALSSTPARLRGYDDATGKLTYERKLGGMSFAPPTITAGRLLEGAQHGFADASAKPSRTPAASAVRAYTSWSDRAHGWQSRERGVYATNDAGKTWRLIYPHYAQRVLRLSASRGVISVGAPPTACSCDQQQLWTADGGRSWHVTRALSPNFAGAGSDVYTWSGASVRQASWPPARSAPLATLAMEVADLAVVPGGVAALLTDEGRSWDNSARVVVLRGDSRSVLALPSLGGRVLARALTVAWPTVLVRTYVFTDLGRRTVLWRSGNGGKSWRAT
jgi:hypothetical protein